MQVQTGSYQGATKMSLGKEQEAFSKDFMLLLQYLHSNNYKVRIGEVQRTLAQQKLYVEEGKSKTYNSMHLRKCAADLFIFKKGKWLKGKKKLQEIGDYWESLDNKNRWGGNWKSFIDCPHFERKI